MSEEQKRAEEAADQLFMPNRHRCKFLGHTIDLRPVPIRVAKELRRLPENLAKVLAEPGEVTTSDAAIRADLVAVDLYIDTVYILLNYYKVPNVTREWLEENATLLELKGLIDIQNEVQGAEDFLLSPLRRISEVFTPKKVAENVP